MTIAEEVAKLKISKPFNRSDAYNTLRPSDRRLHNHSLDGIFDKICARYEKETKSKLPYSAAELKRQEKKEAIAWAHNVTATEFRANSKEMGKVPNAKFWASWELFKDGAYQTGAANNQLRIEDFQDHFIFNKASKLDIKMITEGVKTLICVQDQITTRGDAFNLLTDNNKYKLPPRVYSEIIKQFEKHTGESLQVSKASHERRELIKEVHGLSVNKLVENLTALKGKATNNTFWEAFKLHKEGKWANNKKISRLFEDVLTHQPASSGRFMKHMQSLGA